MITFAPGHRARVGARAALLGAVLIAGACGRRNEIIGRVITGVGDGGGGSGGDGPSLDGPSGDRPGDLGEAGPVPPPAACHAPLVIPVGGAPSWNCQDRCLRETDFLVEPSVLEGAPIDDDPTRRPEIVYPLSGSVHPVNLPRITLQWRRGPGAGQTAFRIRLAPVGPALPYNIYVGRRTAVDPPLPPAEADAIYEIPEPVWRAVARDNRGAEVRITITAYDAITGRSDSAFAPIRFSSGPVEGGLHFLSTEEVANSRAGINRHVFGSTGAHLLFARSPTGGMDDCHGCHSPSRNGVILGYAATYAGNLTVRRTTDGLELISPQLPASVADGIAPALSPDGQLVVARDLNDRLVVYRTADGFRLTFAERSALKGRIDYPEWSPDGRFIAATRAGPDLQPERKYSAFDGELVVIPWDGGQLGEPRRLLVEPDQVHSHPSWSPDGRWIVFASSPKGRETYRNETARLRLVNVESGRAHDLGKATAGPGNAATYPKFAPVGQDDCKLLFVVFQSRLPYGLIGRPAADRTWPQIWMTALDVSDPLAADPSRPPVWLPFQDVRNKNLLPAWSEAVPCATHEVCGSGARCDLPAGRCVVAPAPQ